MGKNFFMLSDPLHTIPGFSRVVYYTYMKETNGSYWNTFMAALVISITVSAAIFMVHEWTKPRTGTVVLPGGITYLGPTPSSPSIPADAGNWKTFTGSVYPWTFSYPGSVHLGVFPGDPYDAVTIFWKNTNPQENVFFRVENLNSIKGAKDFIAKPKIEYAYWWWKQYTWRGVDSVTKFTTKNKLIGYRAKYKDAAGSVPYDHVFLEVPGKPELVIWLSSRFLSPAVFDTIVDSVKWGK
jgi:hypothetical protein